MNKPCKFLLLPFIFVLAILAAFAFTTPVYAQDAEPPNDPAPIVAADAPVEAPQTPDAAPVDAPVVLADPVTATADASGVVDPWFKVGTTQYNFLFTGGDCTGLTNCAISATPLQDAVNYVHNHGTIPSDGFIHVDAGTIPNQKVTVNGTDAYLNSLKGIVGHVSTNSYQPDAVLSMTDGTSGSYIDVINKLNGFTLRDLRIEGNTNSLPYWGVVRFDNVTGPVLLQTLMVKDHGAGPPGVNVTNTNGLVTLKNVNSSGNTGSGAYINNTAGTAGVTVTNSSFDDNLGNPAGYPATGLHIITKGAVTISGVSASRNTGGTYASMWIENTLGTAGVTISQSIFDGNHSTGLYVRTRGAIALTGIDASQNIFVAGSYGADLDNTGGIYGVTLTNGTFENNWTTGLQINTKGNVLLTNVASWDNDSVAGSYGVDIDNTYGTAGNVTITNLPSTDAAMQPGFNNNHDRGVNIHTRGFVTLTNVNALNNQEEGIFVWTDFNKGATLTNCRVDGNNTSFGNAGIYIGTVGPIVINGGHANYNGSYGVWAHNEAALDTAAKPVTISNFTANGNTGYGFYVLSKGAIKLTNVTADYTGGGASVAISLDNHWLTAGITLSKVTAYNNAYDGIVLNTRGALSLTGITADWNGRYGAYITQNSVPPAYPTTAITTGSFTYNSSWGLTIYGRGAITLKDITADHNAGNGAYITNASGNVSVLASSTGSNSFSYNAAIHDGLDIDTQGAVTLNKVTATGNTGATGVFLYSSVSDVANVSINGGTFSDQSWGLVVSSHGTINVSNLIAEGNANAGIYLNNTADTTGAKGITIAKVAVNHNLNGLAAYSYGLITVNKIDAVGNTSIGVNLGNNYGALATPKGVTISSSNGINNLSGNGDSGLKILSRGAISITGVIANSNGKRGIYLDESSVVGGGGKVTLSKITTLHNGYSGIYVDTLGAVTGSYLTSNYNGWASLWDGISILSHASGSAVTISNSVFMENRWAGIYCSGCTGPFTITNVIAVGNGVGNIIH